jgi:hypothetical protein
MGVEGNDRAGDGDATRYDDAAMDKPHVGALVFRCRGTLILFASDRWSRGARRENELCTSGRTGRTLFVLYLVRIETLCELGASRRAPKARCPGPRCVKNLFNPSAPVVRKKMRKLNFCHRCRWLWHGCEP